jgi:hypothetical protein
MVQLSIWKPRWPIFASHISATQKWAGEHSGKSDWLALCTAHVFSSATAAFSPLLPVTPATQAPSRTRNIWLHSRSVVSSSVPPTDRKLLGGYIAVTRGCDVIFTPDEVPVFLDTCTQKCMAQFSVHMRPKSDRIYHIKPEWTVHFVCARVCVPSDAYYKYRSVAIPCAVKTKERRVWRPRQAVCLSVRPWPGIRD